MTKNIIQNTLPLIAWKPEYDLGVHIVDEHHRGILAAINTLHYEIQRQRGENALMPVFRVMQEYTRIHFEVEQEFFEKFNFPGTTAHKTLHSELMTMLSSVAEKSMIDNDPNQFMDFLKKWWIDHIRTKDREFRDYLLGE